MNLKANPTDSCRQNISVYTRVNEVFWEFLAAPLLHITSRQHEVAERKRRYLPKRGENVFLKPPREAEHRTEGRSAACGRCYAK